MSGVEAPNIVWRLVVGFPDYLVSDQGAVMRAVQDARKHRLSKVPLKISMSTTGYQQISLRSEGRTRTVRVNRAVCEAFHGPAPSSAHHAAHLDGDRLNNAASNLAWKTASENEADKIAHGTAARGDRHWSRISPDRRARGALHGRSKLTPEAVKAIRADTRKQRDIARDYGVTQRVVWSVKRGLTWGHVA